MNKHQKITKRAAFINKPIAREYICLKVILVSFRFNGQEEID